MCIRDRYSPHYSAAGNRWYIGRPTAFRATRAGKTARLATFVSQPCIGILGIGSIAGTDARIDTNDMPVFFYYMPVIKFINEPLMLNG